MIPNSSSPTPQRDADLHQACRRVALQQHPDQHLVIYSLGATVRPRLVGPEESIRPSRPSSVSRADQSRRPALPGLQTPTIPDVERSHERRDDKPIPAHQRPDTSIPAPQRLTSHLQGRPGIRATGKDARPFSGRHPPHLRHRHHGPDHPHLQPRAARLPMRRLGPAPAP